MYHMDTFLGIKTRLGHGNKPTVQNVLHFISAVTMCTVYAVFWRDNHKREYLRVLKCNIT